ncbi:ubiquitin-like protein Pup [Pseudactinotalea suaedae]|uniref:ubiquitin-like protein Pup n=1 Tax=Pseudactinotalea suaedae TaxID=1524924 RepID=UPI0012E30291|nr:ubiquitin-like protein Pup [Pseudactinotalea suaedae]
MSSQQFENRQNPDPPDDETPPPPKAAAASANEAEVDSLLAEIDDVLETNAETFVRGFVQKGGQ